MSATTGVGPTMVVHPVDYRYTVQWTIKESPLGGRREQNMAQDVSMTGVWEVWFVLGPGEDEHRDYVWTSQVACEDKNSAIAIATGELDEETLKRLKRTLVRPFVSG